jgi:hypothetical protein
MRNSMPFQLRLAAAALILSMLACGGLGSPTPSLDQVSTMVASTLQALTPAASATLPPAAIASSTPTPGPIPTNSNLPAATRIAFATGSTESVVNSTIQAGETITYVVRALKDQPMIVMLDSPDHDLTLSVFGANGVTLLPGSQGVSTWQGLLPATQDYYFQLHGAGSAEIFNLNLIIMARIQFAAGQNTVVLNGQTVGGFAVSYVARALGGQTLEVSVNTAPEVAALTIWGFSDGQPYARAQNGVVDFSMTLPSTQDYIIQVMPQGAQVVNYKLTVEIH